MKNKHVPFFLVDGRYDDDGMEFTGYVVCEGLDFDADNKYGIVDDDIFYYGMSREEAEASIGKSDDEFTLTRVYDLPKNWS